MQKQLLRLSGQSLAQSIRQTHMSSSSSSSIARPAHASAPAPGAHWLGLSLDSMDQLTSYEDIPRSSRQDACKSDTASTSSPAPTASALDPPSRHTNPHATRTCTRRKCSPDTSRTPPAFRRNYTRGRKSSILAHSSTSGLQQDTLPSWLCTA